MPTPATQTFACPHCQKQYVWKPQFAGRRINCSCGRAFDAGEAENFFGQTSPQPPRTQPSPLQDATQLYPHRRARPIAEESDHACSPLRDRWTPALLLLLAVFGRIAEIIYLASGSSHLATAGLILLEVALQAAAVGLGAYLSIELLSVHFGPVATAVFKLLSMSAFTGVVAVWLPHIDHDHDSVRGKIIALHAILLLYLLLIYALFRLDLQDCLICALIFAALQGLVMVALHLTT